MRSPTTGRLVLAALIGFMAAGPVILLWRVFFYGAAIPEARAFIGLGFLLALHGAIAAPLTVFAVRRVRWATVFDAIAGATLIFAAATLIFTAIDFYRGPVDHVTGTPCGDDGQRKVATSIHRTESGGQRTSWKCVSREEFEALNPSFMVGDVSITVSIGPATRDDYSEPRMVFEGLARERVMLRSLLFGLAAGTVGWLLAFGWRWRVRTDTL